MFENHDTKEMEKYDDIKKAIAKMNTEILKFNKFFWIAIGVVTVLNFLGITEVVKSIIQEEFVIGCGRRI